MDYLPASIEKIIEYTTARAMTILDVLTVVRMSMIYS